MPVSHFGGPRALRAKGPQTCQPRATPWVMGNEKIKALKGRPHLVAPFQGFVFFPIQT